MLDDVLARLKNVKKVGDGWTALCPAHEDRNNSLSVRESGGKTLVHCFAGCDYRRIIAALGIDTSSASAPSRAQTLHYDAKVSVSGAERAKRNREYALRIWRESGAAAGTLVETYLRARGITIAIPASLRFHAQLKHPGGPVVAPAMVAAVQTDKEIVAIHRTWLRSDGGGKANLEPAKAMLGPVAGAAVRLAKAAETLAVAEGLETALSVAQACPSLPVWSALSAGGLIALQLPARVRSVIICADADAAGEGAAQTAAARFSLEGRKVRIARPGSVNDFNDLLQVRA